MKASSKNDEIYEKILTNNLQRTIDFLKFAEAKNAALLAICSAWILAIINLACTDKQIPEHLKFLLPIILIFSLIAAMVAIISFLPRLNLPKFLGGKHAGPHTKNFLYFGDIASIPVRTLEKDILTRYMPQNEVATADYLHDLVVQISAISDITNKKMLLFRWGISFILLSAALLLILFVYSFMS